MRQEYLEDLRNLRGEGGNKMTFIEEYFRNEALAEGRNEGRVETLDAASRAGLTEVEFTAQMAALGV